MTADQFDLAMSTIYRLAEYVACGALILALEHARRVARGRTPETGPATLTAIWRGALVILLWPGALIVWWAFYGWDALEVRPREQ